MVDAAEINADGCRLTSMNKPIAQIDQFSNRDGPYDEDDDGDGNGANSHYKSRSSWLNCALRGDEAVYWASMGHQKFILGHRSLSD